jgi:allophanate hydrolase subunit 2
MQRDQLETQLAVQRQQFEEYIRQQEIALNQQELQIKQSAVQVDMLKVQAMSESDANKQAITQETNRMAQLLELQKLELDQMRMKLSESEKLMEERRLSSENELERIRLSMDAIQRTPQQAPILLQTDKPMIVERIEKAAPAPRRKRKGKIISDTEGNPIGIELEDEE